MISLIHAHQDAWHHVQGEDGPLVQVTPAPHLLLTLTQWHSVRSHWPTGVPVGIELPPDADLADVVPDLPRVQLIALQFPKWTDGRAYSLARLLKGRHGFGGELRATGDVIVDMLPLLHRTGFTTAQLRPGQRAEEAERTLSLFAQGHYQGDVHQGPHFVR